MNLNCGEEEFRTFWGPFHRLLNELVLLRTFFGTSEETHPQGQ